MGPWPEESAPRPQKIVSTTIPSSFQFSNTDSLLSGQSRIGVLVSPIISESLTHEIEVYWNNVNFEPGEKIIIKRDSRISRAPAISVTPSGSSGVQKTGIKIKFLPSSELSFKSQCICKRTIKLFLLFGASAFQKSLLQFTYHGRRRKERWTRRIAWERNRRGWKRGGKFWVPVEWAKSSSRALTTPHPMPRQTIQGPSWRTLL